MKTIKRNIKQKLSLILVVSMLIGLVPQTMLSVWATDEGDMGDTISSEDMLEIEDTSEAPDIPDTIVIPILKAGEVVRTSHTDAIVKFTSDMEGQYYYNIGSPVRDTKEAGQPCDLSEQTIEVLELEEGDQVIYIVLKNGEENLSSDLFTITIPEYLEEETMDDNIVNNFSTFGLTRGGSGDVYALLKSDNKLYQTNENNTQATEVEIPDKKSITHLFVADDVTEILNEAFWECTSLKTVNMPNVTKIHFSVFYKCTSLTTVNMPNVTTIRINAFWKCTSLTTVNMPNVTSIEENAFCECTSLTTVNMPNVTTIDKLAFWQCTSLTTVNMPNVETIGKSAFSGCKALKTVEIPKVTIISNEAFSGCTSLTAVNMPNVRTIDDTAFHSCTSLTAVNMPNVTSIGKQAFYECRSLTTVEMPNVTKISEGAFYICRALEQVEMSKVEEIQSQAFRYCYNLKRVEAKKAKLTGNFTFYDCYDLTTAIIPAATLIGNFTFYDCRSLTSVDISGATAINQGAFQKCIALTEVKMGSVASIKFNAFLGCTSLTTIEVPNTPPNLEGSAELDKCNKATILKIVGGNTSESIVAYKAINDGNTDDNLWYGWPLYAVEVSPTIITQTLPDGQAGESYSVNLTATPDAPMIWYIEDTLLLPPGLTLDIKTGVISGSPTTSGNYNFKVIAENAVGRVEKDLSINIENRNSYNVVYNGNGASGEMTSQKTTVGTDTIIKVNEFTRTGYTFKGWNTNSNGSGTSYAEGGTIPSQSVGVTITLYAQWKLLLMPKAEDFHVSNLDFIYDKTPKPVTVRPKDSITGMGVISVYYEGSGYAKSTTPPRDAGSYSILFDVAGGENFQAQSGINGGSLIISPKAITINDFVIGSIEKGVLSPLTLTNPSARIEGIIEGDICDITSAKVYVNSSIPGNFTDATIDNIILSNPNYIFVGNLKNQKYSIQDRIVTNISLLEGNLPNLIYQYPETMDWSEFEMKVVYDDNSEENVGYDRLEGLGVTTNFPQGTDLNVADTNKNIELFSKYPDANKVLGQLEVQPAIIEDLAVMGLVKPIAGQMPKEALQLDVPPGANYSIESIGYYVLEGSSWSLHRQAFKPNKKYKARIKLVPKTNYAFYESPSPSVTVGNELVEKIVKTPQSLIFDVFFKKEDGSEFLTLPVKAPKIDVNRLNEIDVSSKGATIPLAINVSGLFPGYNEITWTIAETLDDNNILKIPDITTGTLTNGGVELGDFVVIKNNVDEQLKTAKVTITFSGNTERDYAALPSPTAITLNLEAGVVRPEAPKVDLSYPMEKLIGIDETMEYVIDSNDNYSSGVFTSFSGKTYSLTEIIPDHGQSSKYIHLRTKENGTGPSSELATIEIKARVAAPTGLSGENTSAIAGKILGTTEFMEYKESRGTTFIACVSKETQNLALGIYQVKVSATTKDFASKSIGITVPGAKVYEIEGSVVDEKDIAVSGARVKLMQGQVLVAEVNTNESGEYKFEKISNGSYNIVIVKENRIVTRIINIKGADLGVGIAKLPIGKKNSIVEVKDNTPPIVVGALDKQFDNENVVSNEEVKNGVTEDDINTVSAGGSVTLKFLAESKDEYGASNSSDIKTLAQTNKKIINQFIDLSVTKVVTTIANETSSTNITELPLLLQILLPMDDSLKGKTGYVVYRYHGDKVDTISETANTDGEYFQIEGDTLILYIKKFSTYAIAYATPIKPGTGGNPGKTPGENPGKTPGDNPGNKPEDDAEDKPNIIIEENNGGKVIINPGKKKTDIIPDEGYLIVDVLVDGESIGAVETYKHIDGKTHAIKAVFAKNTELPYYLNDDKKIYIGFSAIEENIYKYIAPESVNIEFEENKKNFKDNTIAWAKLSIDFVAERELFLGTGQDIFSPNEKMTRSMFVTVIARLYERSYGAVSGTNSFSDVDSDAYYAKYVSWANENNIIEGVGENKFAPNRSVTREEMAVIILNFAKLLKKAHVNDNSLRYIDSTNISTWAIEGAKYCQETNLIRGKNNEQFAPQETATRAEVAVVIERFIRMVVK